MPPNAIEEPRKHLANTKSHILSDASNSYQNLRYAALDLRFCIESTFIELLTANYESINKTTSALWKPSDIIIYLNKIRHFRILHLLTRSAVIPKYNHTNFIPLNFDSLLDIYGTLNDHLHLTNRYNSRKLAKNRSNDLRNILTDGISILEPSLVHPIYGLQLYGGDLKRLEIACKNHNNLQDQVLEMGRIPFKNYGLRIPHY